MTWLETILWTILVLAAVVATMMARVAIRDGLADVLCGSAGCASPQVQAVAAWLLTGAPIAVFLLVYLRLGARLWLMRIMMPTVVILAAALATVVVVGEGATRLEATHPQLAGFAVGIYVSVGFLVGSAFLARLVVETLARGGAADSDATRADRGRSGRFNAKLYLIIAVAQPAAAVTAVLLV